MHLSKLIHVKSRLFYLANLLLKIIFDFAFAYKSDFQNNKMYS
jgi:hypothetical protein